MSAEATIHHVCRGDHPTARARPAEAAALFQRTGHRRRGGDLADIDAALTRAGPGLSIDPKFRYNDEPILVILVT